MVTLDQINRLRDQGLTQKVIANRLGISLKTLEGRLRKVSQSRQIVDAYQSPETIFMNQWYLLPCGEFARVLEVLETFEYVTVSLHKSPIDDVVLLDGSNTEEFTRSQVKCWRLWDSVNCKTFSNQG